MIAVAAACVLILAGIGFGYYQKPFPRKSPRKAPQASAALVAAAPADNAAGIPAAAPLDVPGNDGAGLPPSAYAGRLVPAELVERVEPVYPESARQSRAAGEVTLDLTISMRGDVLEAVPVDGPAVFYEEAVAAAMRWRYKPATLGGNPVKSRDTATMVFRQED